MREDYAPRITIDQVWVLEEAAAVVGLLVLEGRHGGVPAGQRRCRSVTAAQRLRPDPHSICRRAGSRSRPHDDPAVHALQHDREPLALCAAGLRRDVIHKAPSDGSSWKGTVSTEPRTAAVCASDPAQCRWLSYRRSAGLAHRHRGRRQPVRKIALLSIAVLVAGLLLGRLRPGREPHYLKARRAPRLARERFHPRRADHPLQRQAEGPCRVSPLLQVNRFYRIICWKMSTGLGVCRSSR